MIKDQTIKSQEIKETEMDKTHDLVWIEISERSAVNLLCFVRG